MDLENYGLDFVIWIFFPPLVIKNKLVIFKKWDDAVRNQKSAGSKYVLLRYWALAPV